MTASTHLDVLRPEIASSWERSRLSGLSPEADLDALSLTAFDDRSRLLVAAVPVLDRAVEELAGSPFGLLLADRAGLVVARRVGEPRLFDTLDRHGIVEGRRFVEETTGTNSIATVFEVRRGVAVHGEEHFVHALKPFSCYGLPLIHPVTRRLEGVLDVTCPAALNSPLLVPFVRRITADIELRLGEGSRRAEQQLLAAYTSMGRRTTPVLVLGEDLTLSNTAASELLEAADYGVLRSLADEVTARAFRLQDVQLAGGRLVSIVATRVGDAGLVLELTPSGAPASRRGRRPRGAAEEYPPWLRELDNFRARRTPVLFTGESGSGRSTAARLLAGGCDVRRFGPETSAGDLHAALATAAQDNGSTERPPTLLLMEEVETWGHQQLGLLVRAVAEGGIWLAATSKPLAALTGRAADLATRFVAKIEVPPLRDRRHELPVLLRRLAPGGARLRFLPSTVQLLAAHPWPGNVRELVTLLNYLAHSELPGAVAPADLPPDYRRSATSRRLTPMERAEYEAIVSALHACGGNKSKAAVWLGVSRSTLHRRLRTLRVDSGSVRSSAPSQ